MWYILTYEKTHLCPLFDCGRIADPPGGVAVVRYLCLTPLANPAGQDAWSDRPRDCRDRRLRRSDGPPCHARLPHPWPGCPDAPVLCPPADPACGVHCPPTRAVARAAAPEPAD